MTNLLKFSYFLVLLALVSCGEKQKETEKKDSSVTGESEAVTPSSTKSILFFGNSLTAAYGLEEKEGFPALIQNRLDSLGLNYTSINSGVSGETTSGGLNRLDWVINQKVEVFVLELGANDGLRGIPLKETKQNLQAIIDKVKSKNNSTKIVLAGMQIPPNMGQDYTKEFKKIYPDLAEKNQVELIPFLLEGVAGNPDLNLEDGIHPTAEGQKIVMENVWRVLKTVLSEN
ncbi:MAG: arylesterase [Pseudozobellia sp.]|nr:arylesterase [Pseudozobellia sp.]MBG49825.1 arylesterase [Pseudozobellia sp.]|tara:strand:+ start:78 stop:767 length:690 start_codon:yes stop_codon:yes gene_type:complete